MWYFILISLISILTIIGIEPRYRYSSLGSFFFDAVKEEELEVCLRLSHKSLSVRIGDR
jgi:hypothetical protein